MSTEGPTVTRAFTLGDGSQISLVSIEETINHRSPAARLITQAVRVLMEQV